MRAIAIGLAALALGQLVQPTVPSDRASHKHNLLQDPKLDSHVRFILKRSCADCHSNEARLPWYAHVSPVSWLVMRHVNQGREKLNFSEWPQNSANAKQDIADSVDKREMPLTSYLLIHHDARLSPDDTKTIERWADSP